METHSTSGAPPNAPFPQPPEWTERILLHLSKAGLTHRVEEDGITLTKDSYQLGKSSGWMFWVCRSKHEGFRQVLATKAPFPLDRTWNEYMAQIKQSMVKFLEEEPYLEAVRYFEGFAKGAEEGMMDENYQVRNAPPHQGLYICLLQNWVKVEQLANRTEIYNWLCETLGAQRVPDLEAFQKICSRFEIKTAGPGRPQKNRKKDQSAMS